MAASFWSGDAAGGCCWEVGLEGESPLASGTARVAALADCCCLAAVDLHDKTAGVRIKGLLRSCVFDAWDWTKCQASTTSAYVLEMRSDAGYRVAALQTCKPVSCLCASWSTVSPSRVQRGIHAAMCSPWLQIPPIENVLGTFRTAKTVRAGYQPRKHI